MRTKPRMPKLVTRALSVTTLLCFGTAGALAQIVSDEQPPDSVDAVESSIERNSVNNIEDLAFDGSIPGNYFLTRHQGRIVGLKYPSNSMDTAVDYVPDSGLNSQAYWDEYGLGTYYTARGGSPSVYQIWHTNFTNGEQRQITDGGCIPGISGLSRNMKCVYNRPIASSVNRIAFIQEVADVDVSPDMQKNKHIVVGANGTLRSVRYEDSLPDHMDWSPDGKWLVYPGSGNLDILVLTDPNTVAVTHCPLWDDVQTKIEHPEWVWDGGLWIVYETASNIWRVPVQKPRGKDICPTLQLNRKEQLTSAEYEDDKPQWMNINNQIAFRSRRPLNDGDTSRIQRVWALQLGQNVPFPVVMMPYTIKETDWQRVRDTPREQKIKDALRNARELGGN
jgi:hypothetical protein